MLSFFYRLISRFKIQDDITRDMQRTFEEARGEAWARGWWSYSIFAVKEIGGLFGLPAGERWWLRAAGWGLAGLAAGGIVSYFVAARYTSEATLRLVPAVVSQDLLPHDSFDVANLLDAEQPSVLSRNTVTTIIVNHRLYPNSRTRHPMNEIVDEFRKSVRIERAGAKLIRVAFTYGDSPSGRDDRILAARVVQDLAARVIAGHGTLRSNMALGTVQFFQDQVDKVGQSWLKLSATVKSTPASDARYELLVLARDQKRNEYESVAQKLGIAETAAFAESRGQGNRLELLDAPTLPFRPDTSGLVTWLAGLGCGWVAGLLSALLRALRRTTPASFAIPSAAEST